MKSLWIFGLIRQRARDWATKETRKWIFALKRRKSEKVFQLGERWFGLERKVAAPWASQDIKKTIKTLSIQFTSNLLYLCMLGMRDGEEKAKICPINEPKPKKNQRKQRAKQKKWRKKAKTKCIRTKHKNRIEWNDDVKQYIHTQNGFISVVVGNQLSLHRIYSIYILEMYVVSVYKMYS